MANQKHSDATNAQTTYNRRNVVRVLGATGVVGLAGCSGTQDDDESSTDSTDDGAEDGGTPEDNGGTSTNSTDDGAEDGATPEEQEDIQMGGKVTKFAEGIVSSLDMHKNLGVGAGEQQIAFETLITYNDDLEFEPVLATDFSVVDNRTYVFQLRDGVTFHDGSEWNASVASWNFDRMQSEYSDVSGDVNMVDTVEESGDMEITIHLDQPFAPFMDTLAGKIYFVSRAALEDRENEWMQTNPVGTGAFQFSSWDQQNSVLLFEQYEDYWATDENGNQLPYLDEWEFRGVPEGQTRLNAFRENGNYVQEVPAESLEDLRSSDDFETQDALGVSNSIDYLAMNCRNGPFSDPKVRSAVYYALDNQEILDFLSNAEKTVGPLPDPNWGSNPDLEWETNQERARELLNEAGMGDGLDVTLKAWEGADVRSLVTVIQQLLSEVDINVEIETLDAGTVVEQMYAEEFDMVHFAWGGFFRLDPHGNLHSLYHSESQFNVFGGYYSNPEVDELLDEAVKITDRQERQSMYREAERLIYEDHPSIWWGRFIDRAANWDEVNNVNIKPTGYYPRYQEVWLDQN